MNTSKLRVPGARPLPRHPASQAVPTPTHRTSRSRGGSASSDKLSRSVRSAKSTSRPRTRDSKLPLDALIRQRSHIEDLEQAWDSYSIPAFHRDEFRAMLLTLPDEKQSELISKELSEMSRKIAPIQSVTAAITKREDLISQLYELESRIGEENDDQIQSESSEILEHLRTTSLSVVEHVISWRVRLGKPCVYLYKDQNYLVKMKSDLNCLQHSALSAYFYFAEGTSDPFLLHAAGPRTFSRT